MRRRVTLRPVPTERPEFRRQRHRDNISTAVRVVGDLVLTGATALILTGGIASVVYWIFRVWMGLD